MARSKIITTAALAAIILMGAMLRFYRLDHHDAYTDESYYGFRSIGLIDFLNTPNQPSPFEWFDPIPFWARLSFHDHPPLGFWLNHLSLRLGGVNLFAMRFPAALAGTASVLLVFLITRELFKNNKAGLAADAILAANSYHVFVSRIAWQESLVLFFMLSGLYLYVRAENNRRYFYPAMMLLAAALLVKYTAVLAIGCVVLHALLFRRRSITRKNVLAALVIFAAVLSPAIIYNVALIVSRGHLDFQLSHLLGQNIPEWRLRPGLYSKKISDRIQDFFNNFELYYGLWFTLLASLSVGLCYLHRREYAVRAAILFTGVATVTVITAGPNERFMAMLAPFIAIAAGGVIARTFKKAALSTAILLTLLVPEVRSAITINNLDASNTSETAQISPLQTYNKNYGFNQLDDSLSVTTAGLYPTNTFPLNFAFTTPLHERALNNALKRGDKPDSTLFIYDGDITHPAALWYFTRRLVYDRWPFISSESYQSATETDPAIFAEQGFTDALFIKASEATLELTMNTHQGDALEQTFIEKNIIPNVIKNRALQEAFRVYAFSLKSDDSRQ